MRRRWLDEQTYADLVALCQFLPGPASSQVGIAIGIFRAGLLGGLMAWLGFTLPSALALVAFAYGLQTMGGTEAGWLHGLKVVAVAVVAQAVWGMAQNLTPDRQRMTLAVLAAVASLAWPTGLVQVLIIVAAGLLYHRLTLTGVPGPPAPPGTRPRRCADQPRTPPSAPGSSLLLLIGLPLPALPGPQSPLAVFDSFFHGSAPGLWWWTRVLPLIQAEVVPPGWITNEQLLRAGRRRPFPVPCSPSRRTWERVMRPWPNGWRGRRSPWGRFSYPPFLLDCRWSAAVESPARARPASRRCCAALMLPWSGSCWRRSIVRSGRVPFMRRATLRSGWWIFCCWHSGSGPRG